MIGAESLKYEGAGRRGEYKGGGKGKGKCAVMMGEYYIEDWNDWN